MFHTDLVVAQQLSTIRRMDRIVVVAHGRIVETGAHQSLIAESSGFMLSSGAHQSGGYLVEEH